jgi:hypothetical protein
MGLSFIWLQWYVVPCHVLHTTKIKPLTVLFVNKNCLWRPCLITDREEIINIYRGPSVDASYHATVHLAMRFQRRRLKCKTLIDDGRQVMAKPRISFQPGELIIQWYVVPCHVLHTTKIKPLTVLFVPNKIFIVFHVT